MSIPAVFTGYGVKDEVAGKKYALEKIQYTPKAWNELDVDIKIDFCQSDFFDFFSVFDADALFDFLKVVSADLVRRDDCD